MTRTPLPWRKRHQGGASLPKPFDLVEVYERRAAVHGRLLSNLPIIGSAATFLVIVSKVLLVSGGDIGTALALVDRSGPFQVLSGAFVSISPLLGIGIIAAIAVGMADAPAPPHEQTTLYALFALLLFWLSFVVSIWSIAFVLGGGLTILLSRLPKGRRPKYAVSSFDDIFQQPIPRDVQLLRLIIKMHACRMAIPDSGEIDLAEVQRLRADEAEHLDRYNQRLTEIRRRRPVDVVAFGFLLVAMLPILPSILSDDQIGRAHV